MFQLHDTEDIQEGCKHQENLDKVKGLNFGGRMKLYCIGCKVPLLSKICGCCRTETHKEQLKIISEHDKKLTTQLDLSRILRRQKRFRFFLNLILERLNITVVNKG